MQKVLEISTKNSSIRSEALGWSCNDGDEAAYVMKENGADVMVGYFRSYDGFYRYPTVLHALGDGWKLLAPPGEIKEDGTWEWWLVKD